MNLPGGIYEDLNPVLYYFVFTYLKYQPCSSDYVEVPDNPSLNPAQELSFAAWIYFDTFIGSGGIVSKYIGAGNQRSYTMHLHHDNPLGLAVDCSADGTYQAGVTAVSVGTEAGALVEGEWQHVAMTFRAKDVLRLYVNGEMKAEGGTDPIDALLDNDVPLLIASKMWIIMTDYWIAE